MFALHVAEVELTRVRTLLPPATGGLVAQDKPGPTILTHGIEAAPAKK
jgi:hypothetical protein